MVLTHHNRTLERFPKRLTRGFPWGREHDSRTSDLEGTRNFLEAVLDLTPGYRPAFPFPGYWLYADGEPIVHIIPGRGGRVDRSGETIDHVGFRLSGYDRYRDKLTGVSRGAGVDSISDTAPVERR